MTCCLGILRPGGRVLAFDAASSAGVDLAIRQAEASALRKAARRGGFGHDIRTARTGFDGAAREPSKLRPVIARDGNFVLRYGNRSDSYLLGGQTAGGPTRPRQIDAAGNVAEASGRSRFLRPVQTQHSKPILDPAQAGVTTADDAANHFNARNFATRAKVEAYGMPLRSQFAEGLHQHVARMALPAQSG